MARTRQGLLTIASVAVGIVLAAALLATCEIAVRTLTNVGFQGNSENLFTADRFKGHTRGNTPDVTARAFESVIFTDHEGFRVPYLDYAYPDSASERILILGDSVAFGPGVAEQETFVGLLRAANPGWAIYNSAVIGYHAGDYATVVSELLAQHVTFTRVILVYCLNDVSEASAINLDQGKRGDATARDADKAPVNLIERIRQVRVISEFNDYLREHSKLYLYLKGMTTDPAHRYFLADYAAYRNPIALTMLANVETIATELKQHQIPFTVIISPYEYQLRPNAISPVAVNGSVFLPQQVVMDFLKGRGIPYVDATTALEASGVKDRPNLFLRFDPMHFSAMGHRVMYDVVRSIASAQHQPD